MLSLQGQDGRQTQKIAINFIGGVCVYVCLCILYVLTNLSFHISSNTFVSLLVK